MRTVDAFQAANDAITLASVLMPLVQSAMANRQDDIPDEAVKAARDKLEQNIAALDRLIAKMDPAGPNG